jgi:bacterioferritin (cytochrome b1)
MSQQAIIGTLNRLMANQCYSLVNYLSDATPWTHPGNEELTEATRSIVADHEHYSQRLAHAIEDRGGSPNAGSYPMTFSSLNDLALDYLLAKLIQNQQHAIETNERCVAELEEDSQAQSLASEVLGSERAHLDILKEFLPQNEPLPDDDELRSLVAYSSNT